MIHALISADQNYLGFVPIAMQLWAGMDINPILYHMHTPEDRNFFLSMYGQVHRVPLVDRYAAKDQCKWYRTYAATTFDDDDICIITDADLWPIEHLFFDTVLNFSNENPDKLIYTHLGTGPRDIGRKRHCYLIGRSRQWKKVLPQKTWIESMDDAMSEFGHCGSFGEEWVTAHFTAENSLFFSAEKWAKDNGCITRVPMHRPEVDRWFYKAKRMPIDIHLPSPKSQIYVDEMHKIDRIVEYVKQHRT